MFPTLQAICLKAFWPMLQYFTIAPILMTDYYFVVLHYIFVYSRIKIRLNNWVTPYQVIHTCFKIVTFPLRIACFLDHISICTAERRVNTKI